MSSESNPSYCPGDIVGSKYRLVRPLGEGGVVQRPGFRIGAAVVQTTRGRDRGRVARRTGAGAGVLAVAVAGTRRQRGTPGSSAWTDARTGERRSCAGER